MPLRKLQDSLSNLERTIVNLERAFTVPKERELAIEGTIQRFETTVELFWKTLKRALEFEGLSPKTPWESVKQAFEIGWLNDEQVWLDILASRNTTSHQYLDEELADSNYEDIKRVTPVIRSVFDAMKRRYTPDGDTSGVG